MGVALLGDGTTGAAAVGVLAALNEMGIRPVAVAATGAAALPALLKCAGVPQDKMRIILNRAASLSQRKKRFITARSHIKKADSAERFVRRVLRKEKIQTIYDVEIPCVIGAHVLPSGQDWVAAPLHTCKAYSLYIDDDISLTAILRANMTEFNASPARYVKNNCLTGGTTHLCSLIWPLHQMGADRILLVRARCVSSHNCTLSDTGMAIQYPDYHERISPDVLSIPVCCPVMSDTQEEISVSIASACQAICDRQAEIYDHLLF